METVEIKISTLLAALLENRPVAYTVRGEDGFYTFTAQTPAAAASMMKQLYKMSAFEPIDAAYADAPGAPSPSVPQFAHVLEPRDVQIGFGG